MSELVSILIPAYNAQKWISQTINSALSQTWPNKEIIIVDDGSRDNTFTIAKQFESSNLKIVSQENKGASAARNKALEYAQGDYIQWLDADDLLASNKISTQMEFSESDPKRLTLYTSSHGTFYWRPEKAKFLPSPLWTDLSPAEWMITKLSKKLWMPNSGWLVSRRLTEKVGPWNEQLSLDDDGEYFCRIVAASEKIKFVREAKIYYRQSGTGQLSRSTSDKAFQSVFLSHKLIIQHLLSLEDSEKTRRAGVKSLLGLYQFLYPDHVKLLNDIETLIIELGSPLISPMFEWKLDTLRRFFGWKTAKNIIDASHKLKLAAAVKWDEILYRIS